MWHENKYKQWWQPSFLPCTLPLPYPFALPLYLLQQPFISPFVPLCIRASFINHRTNLIRMHQMNLNVDGCGRPPGQTLVGESDQLKSYQQKLASPGML